MGKGVRKGGILGKRRQKFKKKDERGRRIRGKKRKKNRKRLKEREMKEHGGKGARKALRKNSNGK